MIVKENVAERNVRVISMKVGMIGVSKDVTRLGKECRTRANLGRSWKILLSVASSKHQCHDGDLFSIVRTSTVREVS